jgi:photosystem II stability/assembly factor-like uncharacterized protein
MVYQSARSRRGKYRLMSGRALSLPALKGALFILSIGLLFLCLPGSGSTAVEPSEAGSKNTQDLFAVTFPTENEGWACGRWGTILHTTDGGKSWTKQTSGIERVLTGVSFVDTKYGWAVGEQGTVLHTNDGGQTWTKQSVPAGKSASDKRDFFQTNIEVKTKEFTPYFLHGVHFVNRQKGWAVGDRTAILHTSDGGKTWTVQFTGQDFILKKVSFCDENNGWAVGEYGYVYNTKNGGASWQKQAGKYEFDEDTGQYITESYLFNVLAISSRVALAVGIESAITMTIDGGVTWKPVKTSLPKTHLFGIAHGGGMLAIAGSGLLAAGKEVGADLKPGNVTPPISYGWMYGVAARPKAGFVAVGAAGWIYVSDNSGTSWKSVNLK